MKVHLQIKDELSSTTNATSQVNLAEISSPVMTQQINSNPTTFWLIIWSAIRNALCLISCITIGVLAAFLPITQCQLEIGDDLAGLILSGLLIIDIILVLMDWCWNRNRLTTSADIFDNPYLIYFVFLCATKFGSSVGSSFISSWQLGLGIMCLYVFIITIGLMLIQKIFRRSEYEIDRTSVTNLSEAKFPSEKVTLAIIAIAVTCVAAPLIGWGPKLFVLSLASQLDNQVSWLMDNALWIYELITLVAGVLGMSLECYFARKFSKYAIQKFVCVIVGLLMVVMLVVTIFAELKTTWFVVHSTCLFSNFILLGIMSTAIIKQHADFLTSRQAIIKSLIPVLIVASVSIPLVGVVSDSLKNNFGIPTTITINDPASETTNFTQQLFCTTMTSSIKSVTIQDDLKALQTAISILVCCGLGLFVVLFFLRSSFYNGCFSPAVRGRTESNSEKENVTELDKVSVDQPSGDTNISAYP